MQCSHGGCLIELAQQLAVIMVGKQIINNAQEILIPKMKAWWHSKKVRKWDFCEGPSHWLSSSSTASSAI